MRSIQHIILTIVTIYLLPACQNSQPAATAVHTASVEEAQKMIRENPQLLVIDVRTEEEFEGPLGHIEGARLKPLQEIETWAAEMSDAQDREILLVCRSGNRSGRAAAYLKEQGFKHPINLLGGMKEWNEKGLPVVGASKP